MKKAIMVLYIYFSFSSTFLLLYSWTDYGMIGLWAQTHPQPPSLITHLAALWFLFLPAWQRETVAFTTFIDNLVIVYCTSVFPFYPACFHGISETVIVICDIYWQWTTCSVQYGSVKVALCNRRPLKSLYQFERCFWNVLVLHLNVH